MLTNLFIMSNILDLVNFALQDIKKTARCIVFGTTPNYVAQEIAKITGVSVKGLKKTITADGIRHAFGGHGNDLLERKRRQIGITPECFTYLTEVIADYDYVEEGDPTRKPKSVLYIKRVSVGLLHVVMACYSEDLVFKTMYLKP